MGNAMLIEDSNIESNDVDNKSDSLHILNRSYSSSKDENKQGNKNDFEEKKENKMSLCKIVNNNFIMKMQKVH